MNNLNRISATEALMRLNAGTITAEALVRSCLDRIAERDTVVQAWVSKDPDAALAQARTIDDTGSRGPLAGIPFAVKDVIDTCDLPTQYNSPIYRGYRPAADASCVALTRNAGGIVLGKTVTTEFASRVPGPTRNPHNPEHTPGGSSSGSAAAVADFMVPLAFGTQTGGSVIRPATYCGVVGYKPSFGTINCAGLKHLSESLDTIGVMARSIEDCALLVSVTSGRAIPDFATSLTPRIGVCHTSRRDDASEETHELIDRIATLLSKHGAHVQVLELPTEFDRLYDDQPTISGFEAARAFGHERRAHAELLSDHLRNMVDTFSNRPRAEYAEAMRRARELRRAFSRVLRDAEADVLLTVAAPGEAPKGISSTGNALFNRNWTLLGVPCVTLPVGRGPLGLPLGVQLVADYDGDERLLACAHWVYRAAL
jgi:amidase